MAYNNFGQFRRTQQSQYFTTLSMTLSTQQETEVSDVIDVAFWNRCGNLTGSNVMNNQNCYYLRFGVEKRTDATQKFYLKIRNTNVEEDNEQLIEEYYVGLGSGKVYFECIISPNGNYNQILWELQRLPIDYDIKTEGKPGRILNVVIDKYARLIDIIDYLKRQYAGLEYLTKIGIQGPPSLLMCINREPIRMGKTGIYEINNGIDITSLSIIPKSSSSFSDGLDYFIIDFEYPNNR